MTPTDYAANSVTLLTQIDSSLAVLDASSRSAEKIISDAIYAGSDKTAQGLRGVIAALTGQTIPAFASGGMYGGGLALVGEQGPELINFAQPASIYTASQTSGMFSGQNNAELINEIRALRQDNNNMRAELRAIAVNTQVTAVVLRRLNDDGVSVRNADGEKLLTAAA